MNSNFHFFEFKCNDWIIGDSKFLNCFSIISKGFIVVLQCVVIWENILGILQHLLNWADWISGLSTHSHVVTRWQLDVEGDGCYSRLGTRFSWWRVGVIRLAMSTMSTRKKAINIDNILQETPFRRLLDLSFVLLVDRQNWYNKNNKIH